jgi:hypothetical protein
MKKNIYIAAAFILCLGVAKVVITQDSTSSNDTTNTDSNNTVGFGGNPQQSPRDGKKGDRSKKDGKKESRKKRRERKKNMRTQQATTGQDQVVEA